MGKLFKINTKSIIILFISLVLLILFILFKGNIEGFLDLRYKRMTNFEGKVEFTGTVELVDFYNLGEDIGGLTVAKYKIKNNANDNIYYFSDLVPSPYSYEGNRHIILNFDGTGDYSVDIGGV